MPTPPKIERIILRALLDGETIDAEEFAVRHDLRKSSVGSILSILSGVGWLKCQRVPGPKTKTGGRAIMKYFAQDTRLLKARLDELSEPAQYDFESVNRAMGFGCVVDLRSTCSFRFNLLEGTEPKDPTEVDYIPKIEKG